MAGAGYDMATGLGTPKCFLLNEMATSIIAPPPLPPGTGGAGGADGGAADAAPLPPPSIVVVATEGGSGVEFCMPGSGVAPGHLLQLRSSTST